MNIWLDRLPVLFARLAKIAVACFGIAAVGMALGWSWHEAARWVLWIGGIGAAAATAGWVIGTLKTD